MKLIIKPLLFVSWFFAITTGLSAQTFEFVNVIKDVSHLQTGPSTVIVNPEPISEDYGGAYGFDVAIEGEGIGGITAPILSGPISVGEPFFNDGVLLFNEEDGQWGFGVPHANGYGAASQDIIDGLFGNGEYTLVVNGVSLTFNLSPESFPSAPVFTLSGGEWVGGRYHLPFDSEFLISTSTFAGYGNHEQDVLCFEIGDEEESVGIENLSFATESPAADSYSTTIPANTFTAGHVYEMEACFFAGSDFQTHGSFPDAILLAGFLVSTKVEIVVTPLPDPEPIEVQIEPAVVIKFVTEPGARYLVEGSWDMESWFQAYPDVIGNGSEQSVFFERVSREQFYRVTRKF